MIPLIFPKVPQSSQTESLGFPRNTPLPLEPPWTSKWRGWSHFSRSWHLGNQNAAKRISSWWFFSTHLKNMLVKMGSSSPIFGVKIPKIFELPPPRSYCEGNDGFTYSVYIYIFFFFIYLFIYLSWQPFRSPAKSQTFSGLHVKSH